MLPLALTGDTGDFATCVDEVAARVDESVWESVRELVDKTVDESESGCNDAADFAILP